MSRGRKPYFRIIAGILAVAAIPPLGIIFFDGYESLAILKQWQTGVGAFWGALFGLGAILIGALFNVDLNRKRDERLREENTHALAAALSAEVSVIIEGVRGFDRIIAGVSDDELFTPQRVRPTPSPDIRSQFHIFQANAQQLNLLPAPLVDKVVRFYRLAGLVLEHDAASIGSTESYSFRKERVHAVVKLGQEARLLLRAIAGLPNRAPDVFEKNKPAIDIKEDA